MNIAGVGIPNSIAGNKSKNIAANVTRTSSLFTSILSHSISSSALKPSLKPRSSKEESGERSTLRKISEGENNYCSMCGSKIESDGSCPKCIIPIFIHGTSTPLDLQLANQNISRVGASETTAGKTSEVVPKSSKVGRKK